MVLRTPEHAATRSRTRLSSLVAVALAPLIIAGILVWGLWSPSDRLERFSGAIVNTDTPVTVNGQLAPIGRVVTAALIDPASASAGTGKAGTSGGGEASIPNIDWTITNEVDAAAGLAEGRYDTVITIPPSFSAAVTSAQDPRTAVQAFLTVKTSPNSKVVDGALTQGVVNTAVAALNTQLTKTTVTGVYEGFATLTDSLGEAADGAGQLADGAGQSANGATQLADGIGQAATGLSQARDGAGELATGAGQLADGAAALNAAKPALGSGTAQLRAGASGLSAGLQPLSGGSSDLKNGAQQVHTGVHEASVAAGQLAEGIALYADGLNTGAALVEPAGDLALLLSASSSETVRATTQATTSITAARDALTALLSGCQPACDPALIDLATTLETAVTDSNTAATSAATTDTVINGSPLSGPNLPATLQVIGNAVQEAATQLTAIAEGSAGLSDGLAQLDVATGQLADGATQLADGLVQATSGATQLSTGAAALAQNTPALGAGVQQLAEGSRGLATGATALPTGLTQAVTGLDALQTGTNELGTGLTTLAGGVSELGAGLGTAVAELPSTSAAEREQLATVVATPVKVTTQSSGLFDSSSVPFFASIALWLGALACALLLRAVPRLTITSAAGAGRITARALVPSIAIGAIQGALITIAMQGVLRLDWGACLGFFAIAVCSGVAFTILHQGLVACLGGAGHYVSLVVVTIAFATGIVATVPPAFDTMFALFPLAPTLSGMRTIIEGGSWLPGLGSTLSALCLWLAFGAILTLVGVSRARRIPAGAATP